ncbi:MAG: dipicolinate synthase subunit DpsA [Thermaerobacter sp.]|nr:dipicolinate synthase subunit DpsA [Thermaerobacter sp.]
MASDLTGLKAGIIGGDRRELEVASVFHGLGAEVRAVCLPWPDDVGFVSNGLEDVLAWADLLLAPVGGVDKFGQVSYTIVEGQEPPRLTAETLRHVPQGTPLFIGQATPGLREACKEQGVRLVEFRETDEFAWRNAVPTAEGALEMALRLTDHTLHGSRCLVLGFGRSGSVLARTLHGLGARVAVLARDGVDLARSYALDIPAQPLSELRNAASDADVVFNTIPAVVLREDVLQRMHRGAVVVDIASAPGGTDFAAARRLGISAHLAPGLPGITAPRTAGRIVADTVLSLWRDL